MMRSILWLIILLAVPSVSWAGARVTNITDVQIGAPESTYLGTAVWRPGSLLAWQDARDESIWFCQLNPANGELIPPNGKGTYVGKAASFVGDGLFLQYYFGGKPGTTNGPEWGNSRQGVGVYFTMVDQFGLYQQAKYLLAAPGVQQFTFGGDKHRLGNLPSTIATDPQPLVEFFKYPQRPASPTVIVNPPQETYVQSDVRRTPETRIPLDAFSFNGPRWVPNEHALTTFLLDPSGVIQVAKFNTDTLTTEFLTTGPERHSEAEIVVDPDSGTQYMTCLENEVTIAVYQFQSGRWVKQRVVQPNFRPVLLPGPPAVFAVKPFILHGKLYFFYNGARGTDEISSLINGIDIYLGSGDGTINQSLTAAGFFGACLNPQYYVDNTGRRVHLYYYTSLPIPGIVNFGKYHRLSFTIE